MEPNVCLLCGKILLKKESENNFRFQRRKFCNQSHYHMYYKQNKKGWYGINSFAGMKARE